MSVVLGYVKAKIEDAQDEILYRVYVTDALRSITKMSMRYYDLIHRDETPEKSAEEIVDEVLKSSGLEVIG